MASACGRSRPAASRLRAAVSVSKETFHDVIVFQFVRRFHNTGSGPWCDLHLARPGAVQGAKRGEADPLTARTGQGSSRERDKGATRTGARRRSRSVRFPSLPAGINTDDSDPPERPEWECHIARLLVAAGNPVFGGGSLSSPWIFLYRRYGNRIVVSNIMKTKEFKESWAGTPPRFFMPHPPLCVCGSK